MSADLKPIAVTMGEPAGIGGEIMMKAWRRRNEIAIPPFFALDDPRRLRRLAEKLGRTVPVREIAAPEETAVIFPTALPVLPIPLAKPVTAAHPDIENCAAVLQSIRNGVELAGSGRAMAVVTNPIHKKIMYDAGFEHPGHTEFLAEQAGAEHQPVMMLACEQLRVVPVTIHKSLAEAINALRQEDIVRITEATAAALVSDFAIQHPHIRVAALNPHAGEDGAMGREEIELIGPAIAELKRRGYSVSGPAPADTMFHDRARATYDAAICMYHDQALIPLKTINFSAGVNITLGLPFIRTSPDHGTAFEIAGTGVADESSLAAALAIAATMSENRARCRPNSNVRPARG